MAIAVTRTKVILPRRRTDLLSRPRLLDLLYNLLDYKLVIIAAPAGYGKTSLLVDFAHQAELPVAWYSLDSLDRDLYRFIAHFTAAIAQCFPAFGSQSLAALESASQARLDLDQLVTAIVNDAYEHIREHFLIVLDDYHLVNDSKEIDSFINRFVQDVDENCHVVLASRALLTLPDLPLLVARSQVGGLSFEELAFRPDEIQNLVLQNYRMAVPETAAEELVRETEGWITGLLLSAQTMWQGMADRLRVARVSGVGLYDYLAQQVLEQQPSPVRDFLLATSFLEEFDVELCEAVFGACEDWSGLVDTILQNNLFVLPAGEDGRWIRYHHLFRDFLQAQLEQEAPEKKEDILRRLVSACVRRGEWERAYSTSLRLGDSSLTGDLIEQAGSPLLSSGRPALLAEWIDSLPAETLNERPNLLSIRGTVAVVQGQLERGIILMNQAEAAQTRAGDLPNLARTLARRAIAHRFTGKYPASLEDGKRAQAIAGREPGLRAVEAEALRAMGMSLHQMGEFGSAAQKLLESLAVYQSLEDRQNVSLVFMELGLVDMSAGRYRQALNHYKQALDYWRETSNMIRQSNLLNNLGVLYHLMGDYEQASSFLEDALACAKHVGYSRLEAYTLCSIGDLYAELDAAEAAQDAYHRAREIARQIDYRFLILYTELAEAAQARRAKDFASGKKYLKSAVDLIQQGDSRYEKGSWHLEAGRHSLAGGDFREAIEKLGIAVRCFEDGEQPVDAARAHLLLAAAQFSAHDKGAATESLARAFAVSAGLESSYFMVPAGRETKDFLNTAQHWQEVGSQASHLFRRVVQFESNLPAMRRKLRLQAKAVPFAPPKLTIQAFGRMQVELDGMPVTVPEWQNQKKAREFFFCLLAHPDGLTKDAVGLLFWPESSPAQLKLQFKNTVYRLRHALGPDVILYDEDRYWFNKSLDYEYDVEQFLARIEQARAAASNQDKAEAYQAALALYRGLYLPEVEGTWVWPERERLSQKYQEAGLNLARIHMATKDYNASVEVCQRILLEDPCLEEAHRLAMRAYAAKGNQAAVTRQFERCRQVLKEEIDANPSRQTEQLYERLRI